MQSNISVLESDDIKKNELGDLLVGFSKNLKVEELAAFRGIFSAVAQKVAPYGRFPTERSELEHLRRVIKVLSVVQGHPKMTHNGVAYFGRPNFMTDELLISLQEEARGEVRARASSQRGHRLGVGGPVADALAKGSDLLDLVESCVGPVSATGVASYLFYENEGDGIAAHVDTDIFSINININLWHECANSKSSHLFIFDTNGVDREEFYFNPGELMVHFGDSVVHGRSPLSEGESIANLTIGFQPAIWE